MTKPLANQQPEAACVHPKHRRNRWSLERRARQAARIREWAPWRRSTGPKTEAGKARCARNALRHGRRSAERIELFRRVRHVLRLSEQNLQVLRRLLRLRNARRESWIRYKPAYAHLCPVARAELALISADLFRRNLLDKGRPVAPKPQGGEGGLPLPR